MCASMASGLLLTFEAVLLPQPWLRLGDESCRDGNIYGDFLWSIVAIIGTADAYNPVPFKARIYPLFTGTAVVEPAFPAYVLSNQPLKLILLTSERGPPRLVSKTYLRGTRGRKKVAGEALACY